MEHRSTLSGGVLYGIWISVSARGAPHSRTGTGIVGTRSDVTSKTNGLASSFGGDRPAARPARTYTPIALAHRSAMHCRSRAMGCASRHWTEVETGTRLCMTWTRQQYVQPSIALKSGRVPVRRDATLACPKSAIRLLAS
jgi:hypothetical protein